MKKIRVFLVAVVTFSLLLSVSLPPASAATKPDLPVNADLIVKEIMGGQLADQVQSLSISSVSEPQIVELDQGYAIQIEAQTSEDETALTTIIPYKVDENDNLINSFEYLA
ncbi:hypothetical protein EBB07_18455 [Paenibacillaceae bacterium]|nr:hypothetical protein EBB07_18455 [Paenibacillaceae bacterium]